MKRWLYWMGAGVAVGLFVVALTLELLVAMTEPLH